MPFKVCTIFAVIHTVHDSQRILFHIHTQTGGEHELDTGEWSAKVKDDRSDDWCPSCLLQTKPKQNFNNFRFRKRSDLLLFLPAARSLREGNRRSCRRRRSLYRWPMFFVASFCPEYGGPVFDFGNRNRTTTKLRIVSNTRNTKILKSVCLSGTKLSNGGLSCFLATLEEKSKEVR